MRNWKFILIIALVCSSCFDADCDKLVEILLPKECNIVVADIPEKSRRFRIEGINLVTKQRTFYSDVNTWYVYFNDQIEIGDTVVKKNGELKFYIHKKDTVLVFPYRCGGKVYE